LSYGYTHLERAEAAILKQPGKLEIRKIRTPDCPDGGVRVKVKACGICSADAKMVTQGHRSLNYPRILGHEIAGVIEQIRTNKFNIFLDVAVLFRLNSLCFVQMLALSLIGNPV